MTRLIKSFFTLTLILCSLALQAVPSFFDWMLQQPVQQITIRTQLDSLITDRNNVEGFPATFILEFGKKQTQLLTGKVEVRGKYRRRVCDFPPVMLKFSKKELKELGLSGHNDYKLVTHCQSDKVIGESTLVREFMVYQMYQQLTPNSFRTHLLEVVYEDTESNRKIKRLGFLIEDTDELGERLGATECDSCLNAAPEKISKQDENLMSVFQYMISNADWSTVMLRNTKLFQTADGVLIPVPYDFDFSGFVNASYAIPTADYKQTTIHDRVFLGIMQEEAIFNTSVQKLLTAKKGWINLISKQRYLDYESLNHGIVYLEEFFQKLNNKQNQTSYFQFFRRPASLPFQTRTNEAISTGK